MRERRLEAKTVAVGSPPDIRRLWDMAYATLDIDYAGAQKYGPFVEISRGVLSRIDCRKRRMF